MRRMWVLALGLFVALCVAWPQAAGGQVRLGLRGGATIDPDQVHFGFHVQAPLAPHFRFQPNVEVGVGGDLTLIALNPELNYVFTTRGPVKPYVGGGPGINIYNRRSPFDETLTRVGVNFIFGIEVPLRGANSFLAEMKVGAGNTPELKMTFGVTF